MILKSILTPLFFGMLGIFAYAPFSIKFLIFFSYFYLIKQLISSVEYRIYKVFFWGIGHWGFGMSWLIVSVYYYGESSITVSLLIFILLTIILSITFTMPFLLIKKLFKILKINSNSHKLLFMTSMLLIGEFSRYFLLNGVPWLIPGNIYLDTLSQNLFPLFGAVFGSLLIYFFSSALVIFYKEKLFYILVVLTFFTLIPQFKNVESLDGLKISIIQPSSDPFLKYKGSYFRDIENNILNLIGNIAKDTELIVLPEAELPYSIETARFNYFLDKTKNKNKIVMGAWVKEQNKIYNALVSTYNQNTYKKTHLVPFGEYIPLSDKLRGIIDFFDLPMSNIQKGDKNQNNLIILDKYDVSTPICFEIAFPETVRKMNKSSLFMINVSNDTWFGKSIGPYQHLAIARIRSIENNRWTIRSTNDGFSAIISNNGTVVEYIKKGESSILEGFIKLIDERSMYNHFGYLFIYLFVLAVIIFFLTRFLWLLNK